VVAPTGVVSSTAARTYLVYSKEYPDSTLHVVRDSSDDNNDDNYKATCQRVTGGLGGLLNDPAMNEIGVTFTRSPVPSPMENRTLVMLSTPKYSNQYMYVSSMGWEVQGYRNDPGAGGYWWFDPPLPQEVQESLLSYSGPRCSSFCGSVSDIGLASNLQIHSLLILLLTLSIF
jgi:hypothetical protein